MFYFLCKFCCIWEMGRKWARGTKSSYSMWRTKCAKTLIKDYVGGGSLRAPTINLWSRVRRGSSNKATLNVAASQRNNFSSSKNWLDKMGWGFSGSLHIKSQKCWAVERVEAGREFHLLLPCCMPHEKFALTTMRQHVVAGPPAQKGSYCLLAQLKLVNINNFAFLWGTAFCMRNAYASWKIER